MSKYAVLHVAKVSLIAMHVMFGTDMFVTTIMTNVVTNYCDTFVQSMAETASQMRNWLARSPKEDVAVCAVTELLLAV